MQNSNEFELRWILDVLRRWWKLILGCSLAAGFAAFLATTLMEPTYEATTTLLVSPGQNVRSDEYSTLVAGERLALTYIEMLKGDVILQPVIAKLGLNLTTEELAKNIKPISVRDTQLIRLIAKSSSPSQAALLANTVAAEFITHNQALQEGRYRSTLESLDAEMETLTASTRETQSKIDVLNAGKTTDEAKVSNLQSQLSEFRNDYRSLEREYQNLQVDASQVTDMVKVVEPAQETGQAEAPTYQATTTLLIGNAPDTGNVGYFSGLNDEQLSQTLSKMLVGRNVLERVIQKLGLKESPDGLAGKIRAAPLIGTKLITLTVFDNDTGKAVQIADGMIEVFLNDIKSILETPFNSRLDNMQQQLDDLATKIDETQVEIDSLIANKVQVGIELAQLERYLLEQQSNYQTIQAEARDIRLAVTDNAEVVMITEPAKEPAGEANTGGIFYSLLAAVVGALVATGAAFLIEYVNEDVQSPTEINRTLGLTVLGTIGKLSHKEKGVVIVSQPRSPNAEAFRVLAANIRYSALVNPLHILLVTSPMAQEGKTTVTANLAAALAKAELRVMVVDADLRKPQQHRLFGVKQSGGLTSALLEGSLDGRVKQVESAGLRILTSGHLPPNPAEMLGSTKMLNLLEELRKQVDMVIIDCPPVLPVADAAILAPHVDGVLMVLRANYTRGHSATEALESLRKVDAHLVGAVLNAAPRGKGYNYYSKSDGHKAKTEKKPGIQSSLEGLWNKVWKKM
jgi:polysaccharide biosynthesis transport protein